MTRVCAFCQRVPCVCDRDAGDVAERAEARLAHDVDVELDIYAELRRREAADRATHWLRPYRATED